MNLKVGGQCIEQRLGYTVKTLKFEKGGGHDPPPPPPTVAPPLPLPHPPPKEPTLDRIHLKSTIQIYLKSTIQKYIAHSFAQFYHVGPTVLWSLITLSIYGQQFRNNRIPC